MAVNEAALSKVIRASRIRRTEGNADRMARRKALGAYYTPDRLSAIVADWAISSPTDRVIEPGFGGCGFLVAAKLRLEALGQAHPHDFISGCDVDEEAFGYLKKIFGFDSSAQQFPKIDFLLAKSGETWAGRKFQVALGNPPYVAYQALGAKRDQYQATLKQAGWGGLSARASLWAYFVLHALSFLETGGRIAWVLPGSLVRANYAAYVKKVISKCFSRAAIFHVHERLFSRVGADEESVILVADGFNEGGISAISEHYVEQAGDLVDALRQWRDLKAVKSSNQRVTAQEILDNACNLKSIALGDILTARIGLVTGDNKYFLFTRQRAADEGLAVKDLHQIIAKGAMAPGLIYGKRELNQSIECGHTCYLLSSPTLNSNRKDVARYLGVYPDDKIKNTSTFKKRKKWHETIDGNVPDAFWPVMRDLGPKIILNPLGVHCTNTLHRLFFKPGVTLLSRKVAAICLQSTYAQLCAELSGRSYGSGVLKHEPRDVEKIKIPWPDKPKRGHTNRVFSAIDFALRSGRYADATRIADSYVGTYARKAYGLDGREVLRAALNAVRDARLPLNNQRVSLLATRG